MDDLAVDCSAGTIVWVRRRNGSWWPGKIVGSDELSFSHLMSPRSGTPVKLLGRDDASVDWYNLEKSKRVKAFRCGEFDDCIDKAEKSQGVAIKKREKYARREDAILHALEMERQQLEKKQNKLLNANSASSKKPTFRKKESGTSKRLENGDCKSVKIRSQPLRTGLDSSVRTESIGNHGIQSNSKEKSEALPRRRGLQDLGLRIAPKRKAFASIVSRDSRRPWSVDSHAHAPPSFCGSRGGAGPATSCKSSLASKRKRTQSGLVEESLVKRRDRTKPLVQVLLSSAKLTANLTSKPDGDIPTSMQGEKELSGVICHAKRSHCVYLPADSSNSLDLTECPGEMQVSPSQFGADNCHLNPGSLTEETTASGLMDEDGSYSTSSEPDMDEDQALLSESILTEPVTGQDNDFIQGQTESMSSDELDEAVAVDDYMSRHHSHDQVEIFAADVGMSKWQLKGKRNIRNFVKRPTGNGKKISEGPIHERYLESKGNWSNQRALGEKSYVYDESEVIDKNLRHNQMARLGTRRYPLLFKIVSEGRDRNEDVDPEEDSGWETEGLPQEALKGYWDESDEGYDQIYTGPHLVKGKDSMLVDVDLNVQASCQGEHVPLVSLMSRLNGKAIVGHPIQIEVLEEGSSDVFLFINNDFSKEPMDDDGSTTTAPVWRTARRTAMHRIPRPWPLSAVNGDDADDHLPYSDPENKPECYTSHALHPCQIGGKSSDVYRRTENKYPKKPTKKVSLSSKKARRLSSIAIQQRIRGKGSSRKVVNKSGLDSLIKPENGFTTVTCIPVKLVFSRLLEAVGKPPSRPANHSLPISRNTQK